MRPHIVNLFALPSEAPHDALAVHASTARGLGLLATDDHSLGADVLWLPPDRSFPVHAHPGDHLLLCLAGRGSISIGRETFEVVPGDLYLVPGRVPHAVGATGEGHALVAIGAPHKTVDSPERMVMTDWEGEPVMVPIAADGRPACLCSTPEDHEPWCPRVGSLLPA